MKVKAVFECRENEEYGSLGWAMVGRPWADPLTGMAMPHDMLEHSKNDTGTVEEEIQALAASVLVRNDSQYYSANGRRDCNPAHHIAADFPQLMGRYLNGRELMTPPKTQSCPKIDDIAADLFTELEDNYKEELERPLTDSDKESIRGWLRVGYRRALKRYKGISPYILCQAFQDCEKQVERQEMIDGMQLAISIEVNAGGHYVECEEKWE